jgi:hypothetical protein
MRFDEGLETKRATGFSTLWPLRKLKTISLCDALPKRSFTTQREGGDGGWRGKLECHDIEYHTGRGTRQVWIAARSWRAVIKKTIQVKSNSHINTEDE